MERLSLDFVGTAPSSRRADLLSTPEGLLRWLDAAGITPAALDGAPSLTRVLVDEAVRLRSSVSRLFEARASGRSADAATLHEINRVLEAMAVTTTLIQRAGRPDLVELSRGGGPLGVLGPIALDAARLVTEVDGSRLRPCAAPDCPKWFVDTSRGGRRRWCSMSACGNRAKARRFRNRRDREPDGSDDRPPE